MQPRRNHGFRFVTGEIIDDRYEVLNRIPGGGMGELYKVRHLHLHDIRAIKILRSSQIGDSNYRERFLREARIAASIKHPNVALLHDFATLPDKSFYMVEEFIDGKTLATSLREGRRFSLNEIVEIARQVLLGLGAIHDTGIIHRDISPDNIMLADSRSGGIRVKIIDLGIARSIDPSDAHSLTSAGLFIGKPHYASPEQMRLIEDEAPIDHRTDLYSLGVVLYEVVSGKVPFEASTPFEYLLKQLAGDGDAVDRSVADMVPPDLEKFIVRLLRAKREERFQSTIEALLALSKVRVGTATMQDVPISEGEPVYPVSKPSGKRKQTAEVPIEQLRRLIEQDRPHSVRESILPGTPAPAPDSPDDALDDSQKITVMQTTPTPVVSTHEVPRPAPPGEDTERTPLPVIEDTSEPEAFLPEPEQLQHLSEPTPNETPVSPSPPSPIPPHRSRRGPNPIVWFAAGIVFVGFVAAGGYLFYRWLDSKFGERAGEAAVTTTAVTPDSSGATGTGATVSADASTTETTTETSATMPDTEPPATPPAVEREVPTVTPPPAAPTVRRPATEQSSKPVQPVPRPTERPPEPKATEPQVEPDPTATETAASPDAPADAPVVLPGSTEDVREGDLVAPGPGVVAAEVLRSVEPIYPPLSANMGHEGVAMFSVLVGPDGKVEVVKLIVSTGTDPLDKSAEDAAWKTVFRPATKNGIKVRMWRTLRFEFRKTKGF